MSSRSAILDMLYRGTTTIQDFNWDSMTTTPLLYLMTPDDVNYIKDLILSPRYSGNNKLKMERIDEVMHFRGFTRFAGGTNRLVYVHPEASNAVFKVAIDSVGINDNPAEFRNQRFIKPFCTKAFECSPCGTIGSFEKVDRITTFEEFYSIADDVFYMLSRKILGKYVMEDIGIDFFMNYGIRRGFGPVILDYPYLFELDGNKLICGNKLDDGSICRGEIDNDYGFNKLVCKKCGRVYRARDLAKPPESGGILLRAKGGRPMVIEIMRGDNVVATYDTSVEREYLSKNDKDVTRNNGGIEVITTGFVKASAKSEAATAKAVEKNNSKKTGEKAKPVETKKPEETCSGRGAIEIDLFGPTKDVIVDTVSDIEVEVVAPVVKKATTTKNKGSKKKSSAVVEPKATETPRVEVADPKPPISERVIDLSEGKSSPEENIVSEIDSKIEVELTGAAASKEEQTTTTEEENTTECSESTETTEEIIDNPEVVPIDEETVEENKKLIPAVYFDDPDTDEDIKAAEANLTEGGFDETPAEEEVAEVEESDEEVEETEDEDTGYDISIRLSLPDIEDAASDIFYCIPKDENIDIGVYDDISDPTLIDPTLFDIYLLFENELVKVSYNHDTGMWDELDDEFVPGSTTPEFKEANTVQDDDDALAEQLKNSSGKKSLDDYE